MRIRFGQLSDAQTKVSRYVVRYFPKFVYMDDYRMNLSVVLCNLMRFKVAEIMTS